MARKFQRISPQDWTRIGFVITLAFFSGAIFYLRHNAPGFAVPLPIFTGALYVLIIAPATIAVFAFLPSMKDMVECLALSRLSLSVFVFAIPNAGGLILANPLIPACLVVTGGILINRMLRNDAPFDLRFRPSMRSGEASTPQLSVR